MSQCFYAIRTSCHLLNLITGFTRGSDNILVSVQVCKLSLALSMFHHLTISLVLVFFLQVSFHLPSWNCWHKHTGARAALPLACAAQSRVRFSPARAGRRCRVPQPPPAPHPSLWRCRVYCCCITCELAMSSLCWHLETWGGPTLHRHTGRDSRCLRDSITYPNQVEEGRTYHQPLCTATAQRQSNQQSHLEGG